MQDLTLNLTQASGSVKTELKLKEEVFTQVYYSVYTNKLVLKTVCLRIVLFLRVAYFTTFYPEKCSDKNSKYSLTKPWFRLGNMNLSSQSKYVFYRFDCLQQRTLFLVSDLDHQKFSIIFCLPFSEGIHF